MQLINKNPSDPVAWLEMFDQSLYVRIYVEMGMNDPKAAVRSTLRSTCAPDVFEKISEPVIDEIAIRIVSNPRIRDAINQHLQEEIYKARQMGASWILECSREVYERCMQVTMVKDSQGMPVYAKFNPTGALKALELAGKHVDVQAFKEVIEHETGPNLTSVLEAARRRLEERSEPIDITPDAPLDLLEIPPEAVQQNNRTLDDLLGVSSAPG